MADKGTYNAPVPALPVFKDLIDNATAAQAAVKQRTIGAAATREVAVPAPAPGHEERALLRQVAG